MRFTGYQDTMVAATVPVSTTISTSACRGKSQGTSVKNNGYYNMQLISHNFNGFSLTFLNQKVDCNEIAVV